jgi:hypothetical protein
MYVKTKNIPIYEIDNDGPPIKGVERIESRSHSRLSFSKNQFIIPSLARISFQE